MSASRTVQAAAAVVAVLAPVALVVAAIYGWIANIIAIAHANFSDIGGMLVLRVIGIFVAPLGAVLGYF